MKKLLQVANDTTLIEMSLLSLIILTLIGLVVFAVWHDTKAACAQHELIIEQQRALLLVNDEALEVNMLEREYNEKCFREDMETWNKNKCNDRIEAYQKATDKENLD